MTRKNILSFGITYYSFIFLANLRNIGLVSGDIIWPYYSQQCEDDAGPRYTDDGENFNGGKYHDGSAAYPVLSNGQCAQPMAEACAARDNFKTAYLEGPISCGGNGWYCRIFNDEENGWDNINLQGDVNFGECNKAESFDDAGYDQDGHCHGSSDDSTYYWWIRDHWFRQYNGRVRCCCGWYTGGTQPLFSGRIANRCDYRRLVTSTEDVNECRDANEDHGLNYDDVGCNPKYREDQIGKPIPEDDNVCWEIKNFGFTEELFPTDSPVATPTNSPTVTPTNSPLVTPTKSPTVTPTITPVASPTNSPTVASTDSPTLFPTEEEDDEDEEDEEDEDEEDEEEEEEDDEDEDEEECNDSELEFRFQSQTRSCQWVEEEQWPCDRDGIASHCPRTCGACEEYACENAERRFVLSDGRKKTCEWVEDNDNRCLLDGVGSTCRESCNYCDF